MNLNSEERPRPLGESFREAITETIASKPSHGAKQVPIVRLWAPGDLWVGIPDEFQGAGLSNQLRAILKQTPRPASFAFVGPPGTGKTRSLWAMLHAMRAQVMKSQMGQPIQRCQVRDGEYTRRLETIPESIARHINECEQMTIITEVGEIRAKRYDRTALDAWVLTDRWLAVDDIGAIEPNEWVREALYHLANERRSHGRTTVWTSNLTPQKIRDTFGGAIASRILGGAVIETSGTDRRISP